MILEAYFSYIFEAFNYTSIILNSFLYLFLVSYKPSNKIYNLMKLKSANQVLKSIVESTTFYFNFDSFDNVYKAYFEISLIVIKQSSSQFTGFFELAISYDRLCSLRNSTNWFTRIKLKVLLILIIVPILVSQIPRFLTTNTSNLCVNSFSFFSRKSWKC